MRKYAVWHSTALHRTAPHRTNHRHTHVRPLHILSTISPSTQPCRYTTFACLLDHHKHSVVPCQAGEFLMFRQRFHRWLRYQHMQSALCGSGHGRWRVGRGRMAHGRDDEQGAGTCIVLPRFVRGTGTALEGMLPGWGRNHGRHARKEEHTRATCAHISSTVKQFSHLNRVLCNVKVGVIGREDCGDVTFTHRIESSFVCEQLNDGKEL